MSNKNIHITHAEKCLDLQPGARKFIQCRTPAMLSVVILIAANSLTVRGQSSKSAFAANVPAVLTHQTITSINSKDTINKNDEQAPADSGTGMLSPELDKQEHQIKKAESKDDTPFDEAMVMAYTAKRKTGNEADAHPQTGWDSFKKYIQDKAVASAGKTGEVQLSFMVNADGKLSDFKIIESLDDADNKAAVDIIKHGPAWAPASGGIIKPVTVKVDFH